MQEVNVGMLGRQNERKNNYVRLAYTSIFGLCFMPVCLMKSNCYSLIYSSLDLTLLVSGGILKFNPNSDLKLRQELLRQE